MKTFLATIFFTAFLANACAQENENGSAVVEQQLEQLAAREESEPEDDSYLQHLEYRRRHRLNLNKAGEDELRVLNLLNDLQIDHLLTYRQLFGRLVSIYELQAIPAWDIGTIRQLLPFVTIDVESDFPDDWRKRFTKGEKQFLLRFGEVLEKAKGFQSDADAGYAGSRVKLLMRYRYQYKDLLQYGVTGDKDAGEEFFKGRQRGGFDFYSFHFFVRKAGPIHSLAIGDFTVGLGQGLIHWQGQAFKKSATTLNIKRQGPVLKPYTASGEFNFHRGTGITMQRKNIQASWFVSYRKWSAAVQSDTLEQWITSVSMTGYHRTGAEWRNRFTERVFITGGNIQWRHHHGHLGLNTIHHAFSIPFRPAEEPYDHFAIDGSTWSNYSIDYSYTWSNVHLFGEMALDRNTHIAMVQGMLMSVDPAVDLALLYRKIGPAYQSLSGNAFTENSLPVNESGFYAGISLRPAYGWRLDAYADFFLFPWLKFQADAPSSGHDYLVQVTWIPNKQTEIIGRFHREEKSENEPASQRAMPGLSRMVKKNWRCQISWQVTKEMKLKNRVEYTELLTYDVPVKKTGFLCFQDFQYDPAGKPWKVNARLQYFESDDYDTRIYAFESGLPYSFSLPAFFDKGLRWYAGFQCKVRSWLRDMDCAIGLNVSKTVYASGSVVGSGQDQLPGSGKTEIRAQIMIRLQ